MLPSPLSSLLLDEPTADLDPERSLAMASLLSAESGQVLMVSHRSFDSAVAAEVFDMGEAA
jgi:ATPase subunit of ABC transporter with duplicated ATPase domains